MCEVHIFDQDRIGIQHMIFCFLFNTFHNLLNIFVRRHSLNELNHSIGLNYINKKLSLYSLIYTNNPL
jgi:hypothetical protein